MSNREGEREWDHKTQQQDNLNVLLHPRCVVYNANDARLASGCGFSEWTDWLQHITRGMKRSLQQIEKYTFPSSWLSSALVRRYLDYLLCCPSPFHPPRQSGWVLLSWIVYFRVCRKYTIPFALSVTPSRPVASSVFVQQTNGFMSGHQRVTDTTGVSTKQDQQQQQQKEKHQKGLK